MVKYAKIKGLNLLGTGDFTHPLWLKELKENLKEDGSGILKTEDGFPFILQAEIANIYTQGGRGRRIHNIVLAPSFEIVEQINSELSKRGRLDYDGRPIFGFSCIDLIEMMMGIDRDIEIIPAHAWTPWFSIFGSKSGFDSVEECFGDKSKFIHALETGLSSDPAMNWRLSGLDKYALVSNSDSHSFWPWRIGREANVFEMERVEYSEFIKIIRENDPKKFLYTIEVDPSYGKYHLDGHRECGVCMEPKNSIKANSICPVCKKPLTIGVLHRVEELADRPEGFRPENTVPYKSLIPLSETISSVLGVDQLYSKKIWDVYNKLIRGFGSEFNVLLKVPGSELKKIVNEGVADSIIKVRDSKIKIQPGFDGVYGKAVFGDKAEVKLNKSVKKQKSIVDFG
ncbi:MAG: DNA helicase UvrD [Candidatus Aenigmatarchaeota archaeon]|nr:MAG: DNA helicase UvrD [Candidatus Aenigmarchaeota archaeon]